MSASIEAAYPLSPMQQGLLFHSLSAPGSGVYVAQLTARLSPDVDPDALERAWRILIERHEVLRASFRWDGVEPLQEVHAHVDVRIERCDWRDRDAGAQRTWLEHDRERGFDLDAAPLMRLTLADLAGGDRLLVWTHHHILIDGRARVTLMRELAALYDACASGQDANLPAPASFRRYIAWLHEQDASGAEPFWRQMFAASDAPAPLTFASGAETDAARVGPPRRDVPLSSALQTALRRVARVHDVTVNILVQAAWAVLLSRYTGEASVVFGATRSCRRAGFDGIGSLVGVVMNTLPHRVRVDAGRPVATLVADLRAQHVAMRDHEQTPLVKVREWSGIGVSASLFDSVVVFEERELDDALRADGPGLWRNGVQRSVQTHYGITLAGYAKPALKLEIACHPDVCSDAAAGRLRDQFACLLDAIAADPRTACGDLPMMTAAERRRTLESWNETSRPVADVPLPALVEAQAARTPSALAVVGDESALTYAELNARANRLAHRLVASGVGPEMTVGVAMPRSVELIVALLATLKAGAAYLPLDPSHPADRLASILRDARPVCVLSTHDVVVSLPGATRRIVVDSVEFSQELERAAATNPTDSDRHATLTAQHVAYVLFTSGSTGVPKGVAVSHGAIVNKVTTIAQVLGLSASTRFAVTSTIGFDPLFDQIFCPLSVGGACVVVADDLRDDPARFAAFASRHGVSILNGTPGFVQHVMTGGLRVDTLMIGGDVLPAALAADLFAADAARRILNLYGPTETCINAAAYDVPAVVPDAMPIGAPLPNYRLYVLDRRLHSAPVGVAGDLYIAGAGLARGYVDRPALTADRFVADPHGGAGARMYRTGDRARWREDGQLEFLGRVDRQVKIRGVRIEPAEVEQALGRHQGVECTVVCARAAASGDARLVAHVVCREGATVTDEELRRFAVRTLPPSMIPDAFVFVRSIPLTRLGKVDVDALPAPEPLPASIGLSRTPEAQILCDLFAEVLGHERVEVDQNFFALGGHSLLATRLASRIRAVLGIEVPIATLFEAPTVAALAGRLRDASRARPPLTPQPRPEILPLSYAQQRLWFIDQLEGGSPEYNVTVVLRLHGPLDHDALRRAVHTIVDRHESLRTHIATIDDEPRQVIAAAVDVPFVVDDLRQHDERVRDQRVRVAVRRQHAQPFALDRGPLLRMRLIQLAADDHVLVRTCHHIVSDGWSQGVFNRELGVLYDAYCRGRRDPLPPLAVQYADFALWQRAWLDGGVLDEGLAHWTSELAGAPERLALPADRPRPARRMFAAGTHDVTIDAGLVAELKRIGHERNATLFMTLLAALAVLFARYTGDDDIVIGSPIANRQDVMLEPLVGFFLNTLALRVCVPVAAAFRELLGAVRRTTLEAYRYQDVPFERIVEALMPRRSRDTTPIVQALLVVQNAPAHPVQLAGVATEPIPGEPTVHHDVELYVREQHGGLRFSWIYDADLFDSWRIEQMARHYVQLLGAVVADDTVAVGRLALLSAAERHQLLHATNETDRQLPFETLTEMFEAQVRRTPDATALVAGTQVLTYRELGERASQLAHVLVAAGAGPERVIGVAFDRSPEMVIAIVAVLLSGAAYLPLDPEYPLERLRYMVDDAAPIVVLTTLQVKPRLPESAPAQCIDDEAFVAALARAPREAPGDADRRAAVRADHPACIIFTSGSTGLPKGVVGLHGGMVNRLAWFADRFGFPDDVPVLARSSISFIDGSTELLGPLLHGGSIVLAERQAMKSLDELLMLISSHRVGTITVVPSLLREILDDDRVVALSDCQRWLTSGEPLSPADVARFAEWLPWATLVNLYGASEASGDSLFAECQDGDAAIGAPLWNTAACVLGPDLEPVPLGVAVTAVAREAPPALVDQLKLGGRMIIPLGETRDTQQLVEIDKTEAGLTRTALLPVRFVPLVQGRAGVGARAAKASRAAKDKDA
jgi:amino acid adenylation domain-containing protein